MNDNSNTNCVEVFRKVIDEFSYHSDKFANKPLPNITFFLGAGFSRAWDSGMPLGKSLFKINTDKIRDSYFLKNFIRYCNYDEEDNLSYDDVTTLYYRLQLMQKHSFLHGRFWDEVSLKNVEIELRLHYLKKISEGMNNAFANKKGQFSSLPKNKVIYSFFKKVLNEITAGYKGPDGIRVNFLTTNYDFVIENILDYLYSGDLPYYSYLYRGFAPSLVNGTSEYILPQDNEFTFPLIKLNGGLEIYWKDGLYSLEYRKPDYSQKKIPELVLPCQNQIYDSEYFKMIFPKAARILQESSVLFVVGYSFPKEDFLLRILLKQFADSPRDTRYKKIFYVDFAEQEGEFNLRKKIQDVFPDFDNNIFVYTSGFKKYAKEFIKLKSRYEI